MNYRHIYHAGNPADIFKHALFAWVLRYMTKKETPFRVYDTHAGLGRYHLQGELARKTGEWNAGWGNLQAHSCSPALSNFLEPFLEVQKQLNSEGRINFYGGSPEIAARLTRQSDKVLVNELQMQDFDALKKNYIWAQQVKAMNRDAYEFLRATVPPPEKRGVILIDPPFEEKDEESKVLDALFLISQKFPTAVTLIWYPIKEWVRVQFLLKNLSQMRLEKCVNITHSFYPADNTSFSGNGLIMLNPPFGLYDALKTNKKELLFALKMPKGAIDWQNM